MNHPPRGSICLALVIPALVCLALPAWPCDGTPPELINQDTVEYSYEITCGRKTEQLTIPASSSQALGGKSGCELVLGDNPATKLHTEMVCNIEAGKLACDLI